MTLDKFIEVGNGNKNGAEIINLTPHEIIVLMKLMKLFARLLHLALLVQSQGSFKMEILREFQSRKLILADQQIYQISNLGNG